MTPYANIFFFVILTFLLIPTMILGLTGKNMKSYNGAVSIIIFAMIFSTSSQQLGALILYTFWQLFIVKGYLALRTRKNVTWLFHLSVVAAILPLIIVKITPFLFTNNIFGFLGISYLTFKAVQIVIEIRDGQIKQISTYNFVRFLLFFPTISSGPIDRYRRFQKDVEHRLSTKEYRDCLYLGMNKIFLGFLYKFIIGYCISLDVIDTSFVNEHTLLSTIIYMYAYSLYLFFDFAGYSAFAVGTSYILGVRTPENFNKPFLSRNIKDFWNRWHMSLSFWFRDYVYMRLILWLSKKNVVRNRYIVSYIGYFALFLLMGLWHGLHWNFIVYGLYHAGLIIGFNLFERINKIKNFWPANRITRVLSVIITFHAVCFGFLIFSGRLF